MKYKWEAVDVTAEGGGAVLGSRRVENVELLEEAVEGRRVKKKRH